MKNELTISEAQKQVDEWIKTIGVRYFSELTNMTILTEEVGELARIMARKYGDQSFKKSDEEYNLADEMADVLWVLICLANQTGIDLNEAFLKNMEKKTKRDGDRHKNNEKLKEYQLGKYVIVHFHYCCRRPSFLSYHKNEAKKSRLRPLPSEKLRDAV